MPKILYKNSDNFTWGFTGYSDSQSGASTALVVMLSTLTQEELLALTPTLGLSNTDLQHGKASWDLFLNTFKTTALYTKTKALNPLIVFSTRCGYLSQNLFPFAPQQPSVQNRKAVTTVVTKLPGIGYESGTARSFAAFCFSNNSNWVIPFAAGGYAGAYTGTVSDYEGNGDFKMDNPQVVVGGAYDMTKFTIAPRNVLDYTL